MKTINLDLPESREQLEDMDLNEMFFIVQYTRRGEVTAVGRFDSEGIYRTGGYFFKKDGKLTDESFTDDYFQFWIDVAMGNDVEAA